MDIIAKLDEWYKEWRGHSHINDSNQLLFDSADCQDFARLCVENALKEMQITELSDKHESKALNIADVSNCDEIEAPYFDKNGKQIKEFAVIKIFHFKGVNEQCRGRKNYYMYKWVRLVERDGKKWWVALHLSDDSGSYFYLRSTANSERVMTDTEIIQQY